MRALRVLMLHSRYRAGHPSGENRSFEAERDLLRAYGHTVLTYERSGDEIYGGLRRVAAGAKAVWSPDARAAVSRILRRERPDVVHVQNTFPMLSASVLAACHSAGVPVVQAIRNYRLLCVNGMFFRDGAPCHDCIGRGVWRGVVRSCHQDGAGASVASAAAGVMQHRMRPAIAYYVTPSAFTRERCIEGGMPADRILVKPNVVAVDPGAGAHAGGHLLYVGRLSEEKGIRTLLAAARASGVPLTVIGDGPLAGTVRDAGVEVLGMLEADEVMQRIGDARAVVVPSIWDEPFGRVVIEAYACGTPVIASAAGGLSELVDDGRTGLLVPPGDAGALGKAMSHLAGYAEVAASMGAEGRARFEQRYSAAANHAMLLDIYRRALEVAA